MTHRSADRRTVAGLLAVAAAVGLAACGGSGTGNGSGDDAAAVTAATAPAAPARSATAPIRRLPAGLAATFAPFRVTGGTFTIHDAGHDPPQRIALLR